MIRKVGKKVAKSTIDGVDAVTTKWTHIFFGREEVVKGRSKDIGS